MSRLLTIVLIAGCLVSLACDAFALKRPRGRLVDTPDSFVEDDAGRRTRVAFPLHQRVFVDGGARADRGEGVGASYRLGVEYALEADFPDEEIWWQMRHTIGSTTFRPRGARGWDLRAVALEGDYLRHDTSAYILIPSERDIRLPAPFDVAVDWSVGGGRFAVSGDEPTVVGWDVVDLRILADFLRDPRMRHRLAVGAAGSYRIENVESGLRHEVTPLSGGALLYGWENRRGTFAARMDGVVRREARLVVGEDPEWSWVPAAHAALEWTPLAVNDLPVALVGEGAWTGAAHDVGQHWSMGLAVRLSVPLRQ